MFKCSLLAFHQLTRFRRYELALDSSSFIVLADTIKLVSSANNLIFHQVRNWEGHLYKGEIKVAPGLILEGLRMKLHGSLLEVWLFTNVYCILYLENVARYEVS